MNAAAEASQQLKEPKHRFSVVGKAKDGGVWISGSRPGSAITEGGINYLTKITPDGKMVGVMSDEHNLFEGIAAKTEKYTAGSIPALSMIKHLLPKRLIAVTPPMVRDIKSESKPKAEKQRYEHPSPEKDKEKRDAMYRALDYMGLSPNMRIKDIKVDKIFIGSCTNGRIEDLRLAADLLKGKKIADNVSAMVVPGSGLVKEQAEKEGIDKIFKEAGFEWREPGCSMCLGMNPDQLKPKERCASTSNRNFEGRQGRGGRTHLVSPGMAIAAAIKGHLTDVREI